jgi:hypothetical protein
MAFKYLSRRTPVARTSSYGRFVKGKDKDYLIIRFNDGRRGYSISIPNGTGEIKKSVKGNDYVPCFVTKSYLSRG